MYIFVPCDKTLPMTLTSGSPRGMPLPLHLINGLISQKHFSFTPLNHIYCSFDKMHPVTQIGGPWGPHPPVHIQLNISETNKSPTPKPYILFLIRRIQWHWSGVCCTPPVHIRLNISETIQNPTPKPCEEVSKIFNWIPHLFKATCVLGTVDVYVLPPE